MTIDDLAILIQTEFHGVHGKIDGMAERMDGMATKEDLRDGLLGVKNELKEDILMLSGRLTSLEERVSSLEQHFKVLEEKMENGFRAIMLELRDIRRTLKLVDRREQVDDLQARMDAVEQKLGMG